MSFITNNLTGNIVTTGSIVPASNAYTLGSATQGWGNIYIANGNITVVPPNISVISGLVWNQALTYSTSSLDQLTIGQYGLTNGISAPYTVVQFTTVPSLTLQIGDLLTGLNIPPYSYVLFVGSGIYDTVAIISQSVAGNVPAYGTALSFTRAIVNAALQITTKNNTDIALNPGVGGQVVVTGNILPNDDTFSLGARLDRWTNLYLTNNIYVTDQTLGYDNILNANNGYFNILGSTGLTVGEFIFSGPNLRVQQSNVNINIGSIVDTGNLVINRPLEVVNTGGSVAFNVVRDGRTKIFAANIIPITDAAFQIIGSPNGYSQPRNFTGTMIQVTGQPCTPTRVTFDSFGYVTGAVPTNSYTALAARAARGTVDAPQPLQAGDIIMRLSNQAWTSAGSYASCIARLTFEARDDMTATTQGTLARIQLVPSGGNVVQNVVTFATDYITIYDGTRLKFPDNTVQSTAWTGTIPASNVTGLATVATSGSYNNLTNTPNISAVGYTGQFGDLLGVPPTVYNITVGSGLTQTATSGNIGITATGVANVTAASGYGQIDVFDTGSKNLVLTLPQAIATNSAVTFGNLTITGNLNVNGTFTTSINATINGKILNLANNATSGDQIDGGGIVLGANGFVESITYSLANNWWSTDGAGIYTQTLNTSNATINFLNVTTQQHVGAAYATVDYQNTPLQVDASFDGDSQVLTQNHSAGTYAGSDFVAVNNLGTGNNHYINMGINGSGFADPAWTVNGPNDGYLYVNAGNLAVGTDTVGTKLSFFTGGTLAANQAGYISYGGRWILGGNDDAATKLQVAGDGKFTGNVSALNAYVSNITAVGTAVVGAITPGAFTNANLQVISSQNAALQVVVQNLSGGTAASTDYVATANNGTCAVNYINMGINSNNYSQSGYAAHYPTDGYLYTSNSNLVISTAAVGARLVFTTDGTGINNIAGIVTGQRWVLGGVDDGTNKLQVTGNVKVNGNITATKASLSGSLAAGTITTTGDISAIGAVHINSLVSNSSIQAFGSISTNTLTSNLSITSQTLNVTGAAQVNSLTTNLLTTTQTLTVQGKTLTNTLQSNGVIITNGLQSSAQITVSDLVANNSIQGQTLNILGAAQVNSMTTNLLSANHTLTVVGNVIINSLQSNIYGIFGQNVSVGSTNAAVSTTTGALTVAGGVGVGGNAYVGALYTTGNIIAGNSIIVGGLTITSNNIYSTATNTDITIGQVSATANVVINRTTNFIKNVDVMGALIVQNTTVSTSSTTGALTVAGGAGIAGNVTVGNLTIGAGTSNMAPINLTTGVLKTTTTAGSVEYDGKIVYLTPSDSQRGVLRADQVYQLGQIRSLPLVAQPSAVSMFGVGVSVSSGTKYAYEIVANVNRAGANGSVLQYSLNGTAVLTEHNYSFVSSHAATNVAVASTESMMANLTANFTTLQTVTSAPPNGSQNWRLTVTGSISITGAGTIIPQISLDSGTPTALSVASGSSMRIWPTASVITGNVAIGNWV